MNTLKLVGKILFLIFTIYLLFLYYLGLSMKIEEPSFKNLDAKSYIILGLILVFFIILNLRYFNILFKKKNKS